MTEDLEQSQESHADFNIPHNVSNYYAPLNVYVFPELVSDSFLM